MSAFARIASEIFPDEVPLPAEPIGKVIAVLRGTVTAALPRSLVDEEALRPGIPVSLGDGTQVFGTIAALDALVPATTPRPDDIVIVEVDLAPSADLSQLSIGAPVRLVTPHQRHALHTAGAVAPLPLGEADWGAGPVPFMLDAQALLGTNLVLTGDVASGKSCTLTVLFRSLLRTRFSGRLILIDPTSGFAQSFGGGAAIIDGDSALIPFGMMTPEQVAAAVAVASEPLAPTELSVLRGLMRRQSSTNQGFRPYGGVSPSLSSVIEACHHRAENSDFGGAARTLAAKLSVAAHDPRLRAFFSEAALALSAADVLQTVFRLPDGRPPMSVLQLGALDPEVRPIMAAAVLHLARQLSTMAGQQIPLMIGVDAADRLLTDDHGPLTEVLGQPSLTGLGLCLEARHQASLPPVFLDQTRVIVHHADQPSTDGQQTARIVDQGKPFVDDVVISRLRPSACPQPHHGDGHSVPPSQGDLLARILDAWHGTTAR
ncbi:MAG: DUF87 domain-containing protein [Pseudomonadota bacterium]